MMPSNPTLTTEQPETNIQIETVEDLSAVLEQNNIPTHTWDGTEGTKTVEDLFEEIGSGETELTYDKNGELRRTVNVLAGDVYYTDKKTGEKFRLREDRQEFNDGSIKRRPHLKGAVAEKIKVGETIEQAVKRALKEELDIESELEVSNPRIETDTRETSTYPGLKSTYNIPIVPITMSEEEYNPDGYAEVQENKTTYFVWEKLE